MRRWVERSRIRDKRSQNWCCVTLGNGLWATVRANRWLHRGNGAGKGFRVAWGALRVNAEFPAFPRRPADCISAGQLARQGMPTPPPLPLQFPVMAALRRRRRRCAGPAKPSQLRPHPPLGNAASPVRLLRRGLNAPFIERRPTHCLGPRSPARQGAQRAEPDDSDGIRRASPRTIRTRRCCTHSPRRLRFHERRSGRIAPRGCKGVEWRATPPAPSFRSRDITWTRTESAYSKRLTNAVAEWPSTVSATTRLRLLILATRREQ